MNAQRITLIKEHLGKLIPSHLEVIDGSHQHADYLASGRAFRNYHCRYLIYRCHRMVYGTVDELMNTVAFILIYPMSFHFKTQ